MSLSSVAAYLGMAYEASVGGIALLWLGYEGVGIVLGMMGFLVALLIILVVQDPIRPSKTKI